MKLKSRLTTLFKIFFAVGIIYWLIATKKFNIEDVKPFLSWQALPVGILLLGVNLVLIGERWRNLLKSHLQKVKFWPTFRLNLMGVFFNFAMPGGVGGDVVKAYYLQKDLSASRTVAFTSVLMDRILGLYTTVLMAFTALLFEYFESSFNKEMIQNLLTWVAFLFAGLTSGLLVLIFWSWSDKYLQATGLKGKIFRFMHACHIFIKNTRQIIVAIFFTMLTQGLAVIFFGWFLRVILGEAVDWLTLLFIVPVGFMIMAIPLTPAGIGVGQAAFYFLFQHFSSVSNQAGPAVITAFQLTQFIWALVGAYFYLTRAHSLGTSHIQKSHL